MESGTTFLLPTFSLGLIRAFGAQRGGSRSIRETRFLTGQRTNNGFRFPSGVFWLLRARFIHMFDGLKRQDNIALQIRPGCWSTLTFDTYRATSISPSRLRA